MKARARPKSASFNLWFESIKRFCGLAVNTSEQNADNTLNQQRKGLDVAMYDAVGLGHALWASGIKKSSPGFMARAHGKSLDLSPSASKGS